ncbi:hypothetical protein ACWERY_29035 [Streptomyces sp. NPDC004082]|uniref:hypothetical protein n=1 Tax=unclassified Streptomyces TaxID=2593676 RepID=UPI0033A666B2
MSLTESPSDVLQDVAALYGVGEVRAYEVVEAACAALVAGLDSPTLRMLAGCTRGEADYDVPELLPAVCEELSLVFSPRGSVAADEAAVRALARRLLAGTMTPWELTWQVHQRFGHQLPLAERLAALDDEYGVLEDGAAVAEVDAEVRAEARRVADHRPGYGGLS